MSKVESKVSMSTTLVPKNLSEKRRVFRNIFLMRFSIVKDLLRLAIPIVLGMLTQTSINLVDSLLVGRLDEQTAIAGVAAIGITLPFMWAVGGFLSALAIGTQAITARRFGSRDYIAAGKVLSNSILVAIISSIVLLILGYFLIPSVFPLFTHDPLVTKLGIEYCIIRFLGLPSMVLTVGAFKAFFDGIGKTTVFMVTAIIMNVCNLILAYALIFGELGFPRMEVAGSAWATVISTYIGLTILFFYTLLKSENHCFHIFRMNNWSLSSIKELVSLSLPSGLATLFVMSGVLVFLRIVAYVDLDENNLLPLNTTASTVIINIMLIFFMISMSLGTASATMVSQNMGVCNYQRVEFYAWTTVKLGMYALGFLGILLVLWPDFFLGLFLPSNKEIVELGKELVIQKGILPLRIMGFHCSLVAAAIILSQSLYGAGNTKFVLFVEIILHVGCLLPLTYFLAITFRLGIDGVWLGAGGYIVCLALVVGYKFLQGDWKHIRI